LNGTRVGRHAVRLLLAPSVAVLAFISFPRSGGVVPELEAGSVSETDIIAPIRFVVVKSEATRSRDAERLAARIRPLVIHLPEEAGGARRAADRFFAAFDSALAAGATPEAAGEAAGTPLPPEAARALTRASERAAAREALLRVLAHSAQGFLAPGVSRSELGAEAVLRSGGTERVVPSESLRIFSDLLVRFAADLPRTWANRERAIAPLLAALYRPTLTYDREATELLRDEARRGADSVEAVVLAGQRIVGAHEVVTEEQVRRVQALRSALAASGVGRANTLLASVGALGLNTLIAGLFGVMLLFYRPELYRSWRSLATFACGFALTAVAAGLLARYAPGRIELIPVALPTILFAILFDARIAAVAAMALAALIGAQPVLRGTDALVFCFVGGVAAALSLGKIRSRTQAYTSVIIVAAIYAAAAAVSGAAANETLASIGVSAGLGGVNALLSAALAMIMLPLLEQFTRSTTDLRLIELADPSRPLLRRLATEAPGTYAHSVAMANLCEAACNAIGANGLLARVGCYYHDVGKLANPLLFAENMGRGKSPHEQLSAEQSAAVIRRHVEDGLALAREHGLPEVLRRFIPEHHGTQEITFFLGRARESGAVVRSEAFRYPGPRPQSAETAVALLADAVEAALRVLDEPTPEKLRDAIGHLVDQRIESGQLRDAPLTLREIEIVKREFLRVLAGMYHQRVEYPENAGGITADWEISRSA
jgi:putative nucleotidyltransferase with HDIG domain